MLLYPLTIAPMIFGSDLICIGEGRVHGDHGLRNSDQFAHVGLFLGKRMHGRPLDHSAVITYLAAFLAGFEFSAFQAGLFDLICWTV